MVDGGAGDSPESDADVESTEDEGGEWDKDKDGENDNDRKTLQNLDGTILQIWRVVMQSQLTEMGSLEIRFPSGCSRFRGHSLN